MGKCQTGGNQISILVAKNLKLIVFMFKSMKCCSKAYDIKHVNGTSVLCYQHQWELKQEKTDNIKASKVDKNNWAKTMENIVLYLKLVRGVRGSSLACVIQHHVKVEHILPGYGAHLKVDKGMTARAPIVKRKSNFKLNQESLDRVYLDYQCDTFKVDNALVYQILLKVFTGMDTYGRLQMQKES